MASERRVDWRRKRHGNEFSRCKFKIQPLIRGLVNPVIPLQTFNMFIQFPILDFGYRREISGYILFG
jgi:hypothetical protein